MNLAGRIVRWAGPSLLAACLGAVVAGLVEGVRAGFGAVGSVASTGFAAMLAIPVCLVLALAARGLWAAWRPARLAPAVVEEGGGAPRLAGWIVFLLLGAVFLSWATFNGVRILARVTMFKPDFVALAMPVFVLPAAGLLALVSRPVVDVLTVGLRALDARARRRLGRSILTPRAILGITIGGGAALVLVAWFVSVRPRIGPLDPGIVIHPVIALAVTAAAHPAWRRLRGRGARRAAIAAIAAATVGALATAQWVRRASPSRMLSIWAQPTIGGLAVDTLYDVDEVRSKAMLEKYRPAPRPGAAPRSIVLVTIDTVRHDSTPLGGGKAAMPALAGLGARGAVFERAIAPSNVTRRSIPAMILGASPPRAKGRVVGWALRLDPRHVPLAERLLAAGYQTAGFFCCKNFWAPEKKTGYSRGLEEVVIDPDGEVLTGRAVRWLADHDRSRPAFLWLHFIEVHNWMKRKDGGKAATPRESRQRRYDKALAEVDGYLRDLVAAIERIPEAERPILVVTSDHGEGLGDHGMPFHSSDLHDSQIRVPLVIAGPGVAPRRIAEPVSLTDLAPTILDLAGFVPPGMPDMDGRSIADLATGARAPDPEGGYAYAVMIQDRSTSHSARAIVRGRWKLIDGPKGLELFDVRGDPAEATNLAEKHPEVVAELRRLLEERAAIDARPPF